MVADPFPIDQHFVKNPSDLYENVLDDLVLDLENDVIEEGKLSPEFSHSPEVLIIITFQSSLTMRRIRNAANAR